MNSRWFLLAAAACAMAGLAIWLLPLSAPSGRTLDRLQREGIIRIGYAIEPPYAFLNTDGEPTGSEIEVARAVATQLGLSRIEWIQTNFASLIAELEAGRFDVVAAGMFITAERARRVSFSEPTLHVEGALMVRLGNPRRLHTFDDIGTLAEPPVKIAVLGGSVEETQLRKAGIPQERIVVVPDASTGKAAVESGLVDGLALSAPTVRFMARRETASVSEMASPFHAPAAMGGWPIGYTADVFRLADRDLQAAWNRHLQAFIGSPEHLRLIAAFGLGEEDLPKGRTTAEVLASASP